MFEKWGTYIKGEVQVVVSSPSGCTCHRANTCADSDELISSCSCAVQASVEDHNLLENLHTATADKFKELAATASAQNNDMAALQAKHAVRKCLPAILSCCKAQGMG